MVDAEPAFRRLRPQPPLHVTVQAEIRNFIVAEGLRPGDPLKPEAELARLFGVGRNSVREAVKALESTGVLETRRGSGVYVRDFSFAPLLEHLPYGLMQGQRTLAEFVALRKALEASMIADAMDALTEESIATLRAVLAEMKQAARRGDRSAELDRQFHRLLFVDLHNTMLLELFDLFWLAFHRAAPPLAAREPLEIYHSHADIFDAVVSGVPERARAAVRQHYVGIETRFRDSDQHSEDA